MGGGDYILYPYDLSPYSWMTTMQEVQYQEYGQTEHKNPKDFQI